MTKTGFVFANLLRKKSRFILTLLSIVMAFLLFGLLQAVNVVFSAGADFLGATRLITQSRVSFTQSLPMRHLPQIEAVPGVAAVAWQQWFGGVRGENEQLFVFAVPPDRWRRVYPEFVMPDEQWKAFEQTRTGAVVGRMLANAYQWKIGDKLPIASNIFPNKDGTKAWEFDIVGIFDGKDEQWQSATNQIFIQHEYFKEANQFGLTAAGIYVESLKPDADPATVTAAIDALFENSSDETKTQSERDWNVNFIKQIGDIGLMVRWILFAVFFTLLLVVGNTIAQSIRERVPELAILKTLGYSDGAVLGFVLIESALLCLIGALIGMSIATGLGAMIQSPQMPPIRVDWSVWRTGVVLAIVLSLAVGLLPALRAQRLKIVDALAGR